MNRLRSDLLAVCPELLAISRGTKRPRPADRQAKATMMVAVDRYLKQLPEARAYYEKKRERERSPTRTYKSWEGAWYG